MSDRVHATNSSPTPPANDTGGLTGGHFAPGTNIPHRFLEGLQESNVRPIEDAGMTPDINDYDQFPRLLSGVHGIVSSVRTTLATLAVTTKSKRVAIAAESALCSAIDNAVIAGKTQAVTGNYCAAIAGQGQSVGAGTHSAAVAGTSQTVTGGACAALAGVTQTVTGLSCAAIAGTEQTVGNGDALAAGGNHQITSGGACAVLGGQYYENIDDYCVAGGYGAAAPANFGDGLTNKNITWKLHNNGGKAEFKGAVGGFANAPIGLTERQLTAAVDWNSVAADHQTAPVVDYEDSSVVEVELTLKNSDSGPHDIEMGSSILIPARIGTTGTLINGYARTISGDTAQQKGLRWSVSEMINGAGDACIAVTSVGKTTAPIAASNAETVVVHVFLHYAKLTAV